MLNFNWLQPSSLEEAVSQLAATENAAIYAGGTCLIPLMNLGLRELEVCLSLRELAELRNIEFTIEGIWIGSMVTLETLCKNQVIAERFKALCTAAELVASPQIRSVGTVGGNILQERRCKYFNQSQRWRADLADCYLNNGEHCYQAPKSARCRALYYSDLATPLAVYGAILEIIGTDGLKKTVKFLELFNDDGTRKLSFQKQILTRIFVPYPDALAKSVFCKESIRDTLDFPIANVSMLYSPVSLGNSGKMEIVVGALAPFPLRLTATEQEFAGINHIKDLVSVAGQEMTRKHAIVNEVESTVGQKLKIAKGLLAKAVREILSE